MKGSTRRILDIVLWSSLSNLVLLGAFFVGWNFDEIRASLAGQLSGPVAVNRAEAHPLGPAGPERGDNELFTNGPQRQLKGELQLTAIALQKEDTAAAAAAAAAEPEAADAMGVEDVPEAELTAIETGPEAGQGMSPVLRMDRRIGKLEIGNFETVSLTGDSVQCLEMGYSMLGDAGAPESSLQVLARSKLITMARICATNGAVIITCRSNQVTISPRRLKPNESCSG